MQILKYSANKPELMFNPKGLQEYAEVVHRRTVDIHRWIYT